MSLTSAADVTHDLPNVRFSQRRLGNGLRVIVAPEHLAPVVAINLWYDVGSRHEVPGKTGFAHLFEHFMFQGSRHVSKSEHMSIIQGAGGVNNATTFFDRTNYFETLPSHQLDLACGSRRTGWPRSSMRCPRRTSTTSGRWSRTRSARATTTGRTARSTRS